MTSDTLDQLLLGQNIYQLPVRGIETEAILKRWWIWNAAIHWPRQDSVTLHEFILSLTTIFCCTTAMRYWAPLARSPAINLLGLDYWPSRFPITKSHIYVQASKKITCRAQTGQFCIIIVRVHFIPEM